MKAQRGLFGWVSFGTNVETLAAADAMLMPEALVKSDVAQGQLANVFVAARGCDTAISVDRDTQLLAAICGRPRWASGEWSAIASEQGHAAAALAAYRRHKRSFLPSILGNFSLVLFDARKEECLIAIDRSGTERLCFARRGDILVFSTSARSVAAHPAVRAGLDRQALFEYLYCHIVPSPDTVFERVEKLQPAQVLIANHDGLQREFYWQLQIEHGAGGTEENRKGRFLELLRESVGRLYDRPRTGAFLSGGTDSSTVTGLLGEASGIAPETFSIGFDAEGYDELEFARIAGRHFGANAHEFYVTPDHVAEAIPLIASAYDEPFGNASAVPTFFCARLAHEHGIEVMLAGDGGDEFFGGNARYAKQGMFEYYQAVPAGLRKWLEPVIFGVPLGESLTLIRKARSYIRQAQIPLPDRLESYNFLHRTALLDIFEPEFLATIDADRPLALMREAYHRSSSPAAIDKMMQLDHKFTLADNDLRKVGRMCEAAGVEVRYPFLDDDLIDFSGTLKLNEKVDGNRLRVLFKEALKGFLPDETIAKSKHGFGLPFGDWLANDNELRLTTLGALSSLSHRGIVRKSYIDDLIIMHGNEHAGYYGVMIWVLVQLELWLQAHSRTAF